MVKIGVPYPASPSLLALIISNVNKAKHVLGNLLIEIKDQVNHTWNLNVSEELIKGTGPVILVYVW